MKSVDGIEHLTIRGSSYVYVRRVPSDMRGIEKRQFIRRAIGKIKKLSLEDARRKVDAMDRDFDAYWDSLRCGDADRAAKAYASALHTARLFGFSPASMSEITQSPDELQRRLAKLDSITVQDQPFAEDAARGLLGAVPAEAVRAAREPSVPPARVGRTAEDIAQEDIALHGAGRTTNRRILRGAMLLDEFVRVDESGDLIPLEALLAAGAGDEPPQGKKQKEWRKSRALPGEPLPFDDIRHAHALQMRRGLQAKGDQPNTVKTRLNNLRSLWTRWSRMSEVDRPNPFSGSAPSVKNQDSNKLPFHLVHLEIIERGRYVHNSTRAQLRLMRACGIGPKELIGIRPGVDIDAEDGVPHLWIRKNGRRGVKAEKRDRLIPLVSVSIEEARLACLSDDEYDQWVARLEARDRKAGRSTEEHMLPERIANSVSGKLNDAIVKTAGLPDAKRLTVNCFRHTLKHALRVSGAAAHLQARIMGHALEKGAAGIYGTPHAELLDLQATMIAAHTRLGHVPLAAYDREGEIPDAIRPRAEELARLAKAGAMQTIPASPPPLRLGAGPTTTRIWPISAAASGSTPTPAAR